MVLFGVPSCGALLGKVGKNLLGIGFGDFYWVGGPNKIYWVAALIYWVFIGWGDPIHKDPIKSFINQQTRHDNKTGEGCKLYYALKAATKIIKIAMYGT